MRADRQTRNDPEGKQMDKWEQNIRRVTPYVPGEQPGRKHVIKLNTNENPYPPSPLAAEALKQFPADELRKYPDPEAGLLAKGIAQLEDVDPEQIFVGVGSDDVLAMIFLTFFNGSKPIFFPDITYSFYDVWAKMLRIPYEQKPLNAALEIESRDYYAENGGVVFPNPNAPTGVYLDLDAVEDILGHNTDVIVVVDEAYIDFGGQSCTGLLKKYENLLVVKTFSKSRSLAGMRIGYAIGSPKLIRYLKQVKYSFNSYTMNQTSIAVGAAALKDQAYFEKTRGKIIATREQAKSTLGELGFLFPDSMANFLFVTHARVSAEELYEALYQQGIYVRYFKKPRIENYLRISIGTDDEMSQLYQSLRTFL